MTDHRQFFRLALAEAWGSPDPSTQTGAIIVDAGGRVVSGGCNDFPEGVAAKPERLERPLKYSFMEHAERNAIYSAGEIVDTDVMYALWAACDDCARAIIQSGIRTVHTHGFYLGNDAIDKTGTRRDWGETLKVSFTMFEEAGVDVIYHDFQVMRQGESLLYNGEPVRF